MTDINWRDYITSDPAILFGKPVIKGTRVPVHLILEKLGQGEIMFLGSGLVRAGRCVTSVNNTHNDERI